MLLLFGFDYVVIGLATAYLPVPQTSVDGYAVARAILPLESWGLIWAALGLFGMATAFLSSRRDDWGYYGMAGFGLLWASMAGASSILFGAPRGWILAIIWGSFAAALMIVSGMDRDE